MQSILHEYLPFLNPSPSPKSSKLKVSANSLHPMSRWFNIARWSKADKHYMLSPTSRLPNLSMVIEQESYFVVHAPRQTGKTTAMLALAQQLTASGRYTAVMVSVEVGSAFNHNSGAAELAILGTWYDTISIRLPDELQPPVINQWQKEEPGRRIRAFLQAWAKASTKPLVIFIDEIDSLQDDTLISVVAPTTGWFSQSSRKFSFICRVNRFTRCAGLPSCIGWK